MFKKKRSPRKVLVAKLDALFSIFIRIRDKRIFGGMCPFCNKRPIECCFHFITRSKYIVRWYENNAVGSCHGCNFNNEFNPALYIQWYINNRGKDAFDALVLVSHQIAKFSNDELA